MKYIIILALLAGGYYFYTLQQNKQTSQTIENPFGSYDPEKMPKEAFLESMRLGTLAQCNNAEFIKSTNITQENCLEKLNTYGESCKANIIPTMPDFINIKSETEFKKFGFEYAKCVMGS